MTEFNIADYQIALDAIVNRTDNSNILGDYAEEIKSALTRCAAEPVDAGELDNVLGFLSEELKLPKYIKIRRAVCLLIEAHRASLSNVTCDQIKISRSLFNELQERAQKVICDCDECCLWREEHKIAQQSNNPGER